MTTSLGRKGLAQRERILGVARGRLIHSGLDRFVVREIAELAEMTVGNLQYYFKTREDLLEALFRADFENIRSALATADLPMNADSGAMLGTLGAQLVSQWATEDRNVCIALSALAAHEERFARLYEELYQRFYKDLAVLLRAFVPHRSDVELLEKARIITAVLDGATVQVRVPGRRAKRIADRRLLDGVRSLIVAVATDRIDSSAPRTRKPGAPKRAARS